MKFSNLILFLSLTTSCSFGELNILSSREGKTEKYETGFKLNDITDDVEILYNNQYLKKGRYLIDPNSSSKIRIQSGSDSKLEYFPGAKKVKSLQDTLYKSLVYENGEYHRTYLNLTDQFGSSRLRACYVESTNEIEPTFCVDIHQFNMVGDLIKLDGEEIVLYGTNLAERVHIDDLHAERGTHHTYFDFARHGIDKSGRSIVEPSSTVTRNLYIKGLSANDTQFVRYVRYDLGEDNAVSPLDLESNYNAYFICYNANNIYHNLPPQDFSYSENNGIYTTFEAKGTSCIIEIAHKLARSRVVYSGLLTFGGNINHQHYASGQLNLVNTHEPTDTDTDTDNDEVFTNSAYSEDEVQQFADRMERLNYACENPDEEPGLCEGYYYKLSRRVNNKRIFRIREDATVDFSLYPGAELDVTEFRCYDTFWCWGVADEEFSDPEDYPLHYDTVKEIRFTKNDLDEGAIESYRPFKDIDSSFDSIQEEYMTRQMSFRTIEYQDVYLRKYFVNKCYIGLNAQLEVVDECEHTLDETLKLGPAQRQLSTRQQRLQIFGRIVQMVALVAASYFIPYHTLLLMSAFDVASGNASNLGITLLGIATAGVTDWIFELQGIGFSIQKLKECENEDSYCRTQNAMNLAETFVGAFADFAVSNSVSVDFHQKINKYYKSVRQGLIDEMPNMDPDMIDKQMRLQALYNEDSKVKDMFTSGWNDYNTKRTEILNIYGTMTPEELDSNAVRDHFDENFPTELTEDNLEVFRESIQLNIDGKRFFDDLFDVGSCAMPTASN